MNSKKKIETLWARLAAFVMVLMMTTTQGTLMAQRDYPTGHKNPLVDGDNVAAKLWDYDTKDWMGTLPDDVLLGDITILSSHDAGINESAYAITAFSATQYNDIYHQLLYGTRFFDIRIKVNGFSEFQTHHEVEYGHKLSEVMQDAVRFLTENPSEVVILKFSHWENEGEVKSALATIYRYPEWTDHFYKSDALTPPLLNRVALGELRGKILFLLDRNDGIGDEPENALDDKVATEFGYTPAMGTWRFAEVASSSEGVYGYYRVYDSYANKADYYNIICDQRDKMKDCYRKYPDKTSSAFMLCYQGTYGFPYERAEFLNPRLKYDLVLFTDLFNERPRLVNIDYIDYNVCNAVINANYELREPVDNPPVPYLEPVFDADNKVIGYETKYCEDYAFLRGNYPWTVDVENRWYVVDGTFSTDMSVEVTGDAHIILKNGTTMTANPRPDTQWAGLVTKSGSTLTIYGQSTDENVMGVLIANGDNQGAGIGGCHNNNGCNITINGGKIIAQGGNWASGIGGGYDAQGYNIVINGGKINATGGEHGAGIGGGENRDGHNIFINGGDVTATGGIYASGIGGGNDAGGHDIIIRGGNVTANGGENGAGIGGGKNRDGYDITVNDGTVSANSGGKSAGIGGGYAGSGHDITINGGTVSAIGVDGGAAIGGGWEYYGGGNGSHITVNGGNVTAQANGNGGAGIGGGHSGNGEYITINGGYVTTIVPGGGAGIGGGQEDQGGGYGKNIVINGGTVNADNVAHAFNIGYGNGAFSDQDHVVINGGNVFGTRGDGGQPQGIYAPLNSSNDRVYEVTVPDVAGNAKVNVLGLGNYGVGDFYPVNGILKVWLPNGTYSFEVESKGYTVTVNNANVTATPYATTLLGVKVNGKDVAWGSGTGWTFSNNVLTLSSASDYTLTGSNTGGNVFIDVTADATLTLDNLNLTCANPGRNLININADVEMELDGTNNIYAGNYAGAIYVSNGHSLTIDGDGELVGGKSAGYLGRCVTVAAGGSFVMDGGTIRDYKTHTGGAIRNNGTTTINGGKITGNVAQDSPDYGGGIYVEAGTVTVNGGTIAGNTATTKGGDIYNCVASGIVINGGNAKLVEWANGCSPKNTASNTVYKVTVPGIFEGLTEVTGLDTYGVDDIYSADGNLYFWLPNGTYAFQASSTGYTVTVNGADVTAVMSNIGVTVNGKDVAWGSGTGWTFNDNVLTLSSASDYTLAGSNTGGNVFIDVTADATLTLDNLNLTCANPGRNLININADVEMELDGTNNIYAGNYAGAIYVSNGHSLTIDGDGELVGGKSAGYLGRCVTVADGGSFVMDGGTIRDYKTHTGGAIRNNGTTTINGGKITGNVAQDSPDYGGGIYVEAGTVTVNGGTIAGNTATTKGGDIYNNVASGLVINGGSTNLVEWNNVSGCSPKDGKNNDLCRVTVTDVTGNPAVVTGLDYYGVNDLYPVEGKLYFWLQNGTHTFMTAENVYDATVDNANVTATKGVCAQLPEIPTTGVYEGDYIIPTTTTIANGVVVTVTGRILNSTKDNLIIEDGGQLIIDEDGVTATVKKAIAGTTKASDVNWYTISSPLEQNVGFTYVTNLIPTSVQATDYDLYRLDEENSMWVNSRIYDGHDVAANHGFATINKGCGYVYFNNAGNTISFTGKINVDDVDVKVTVGSGNGFNLIGNPFTQNITMDNVSGTGLTPATLADGFYVLSNTNTWGTKLTSGNIAPLQGFLVQATEAGDVAISKPASGSKGGRSEQNANIEIIVSDSKYSDNAYAMFSDGIGLGKISHRNADAPMIYIPQNGGNYAIAMMNENVTFFPVSFKAKANGYYTISLKSSQNYIGLSDFDYLHLVDNMTGDDIDMLLEGSYSFIGSPADRENRFIVKLHRDGAADDEAGNFVYQNGNELIVNGEGTLQVIDMLGRIVMSKEVNGGTVNIGSLNVGAYIVRMTGNEVRVQKMVIK